VKRNLALLRGLIRIVYPRKMRKRARSGLPVHPLYVTPFALGGRAIDVSLDEAADGRAELVPDLPIRTHECRDNNDTVTGKQIGDEPDTTHVAVSVLASVAKLRR